MDQTKSTFYLKYRPQTLNELFGQSEVKKMLLGAFSENRLSHAYLFVGPRGTGKTSTARILAKMINCESQESRVKSQGKESGEKSRISTLATSDYPCNKCDTCLSIADGSNIDLIEIDAASNRGIEDIRTLREKIKLSPSQSKKKVYIIDEVHMLTTEAFNALLKTLEEPPSHVIFILATTEVNKVPQTILSRVQRVNFRLASVSELQEALEKVIKGEKIDIDDKALQLLVQKAEGSFRDGIKLLDQVSSAGGKITLDSLQRLLKATNFEVLLSLLAAFSKKDATAALSLIIKQVYEGVECKELITCLMDYLRNLVFIKHELGNTLVKPQFMEENYLKLEQMARDFSVKELVKNLEILQKSLEKLKFASIPSLSLELAVVEICGEKEQNKTVEEKQINLQSSILKDPSSIIHHPSSNSDSSDISKIKEKWTFVLETIRQTNFSLEALLRSISINSCTQTFVTLEVPYSFHQRILETPKNRDLLESILSEILGRSIRISTILGSRPQRKEDLANIEVAADDEIIRAAAEIFNAETIN